MKKRSFPVLIYTLPDHCCVGQLATGSDQWVEQDVDRLRKKIEKDLRYRLQKGELPDHLSLENPRLKWLKLSLRPVANHFGYGLIAEHPLPLQVPFVYGKRKEDPSWHAYCPWFLEEPYQASGLKTLETGILGQAEIVLQNWSPASLHQLMTLPAPTLETVELRLPSRQKVPEVPERNEAILNLLHQWAEEEPRNALPFEPGQAWQREEEMSSLLDKLHQSAGGMIVVGPEGCGKSLLIRQALRQWRQKHKESGHSAWRISARRLPAGVRYLGEWQELCEQIVDGVQLLGDKLWVEDLPAAIFSGGSGPESSVAAYLQMFMEEERLFLLAEANEQEWEQIQRTLPGLAARLQPVFLNELKRPQLNKLLDAYRRQIRQSEQLQIDRNALEEAYRLTNRFLPQEHFPGKVVNLLSHCLRQVAAERRSRLRRLDLIRQFSRQTGLPEVFLRDELQLDPRQLRSFFEERIQGQPEVIHQLTELVKVFKTGLNNPQKPITSLLFAGPTGVGKTASARALAAYFFGKNHEQRLIRLDMSEIQYPDQIDRLIGSARGASQGDLASQVRNQPFSVILLDEIEKATPLVFDALMNILDEGLLVDSRGQVTHFRNAVIILTTNLGAGARPEIGFGASDPEDRYRKALELYFRPEFLNRIDNFLFFRRLLPEHMIHIARKELEAMNERPGLLNRELQIEFSPALLNWLATEGYDKEFGARPLQRLLERRIVTPLAEYLIDHPEVRTGVLHLDRENGQALHIQFAEPGNP